MVVTNRADREYDIVLVGATGYTGALTAEHIAEHLPTNLKWAIAGRSQGKLEALAAKLEKLSPDRVQPVVEVVSLDDTSQVGELVGRAKVCISVVLYGVVGEIVIKACIENATDYVDTAGDIPRFRQWIDDYDEKAKAAGIVIIHSVGALSAPHDLLVWSAVNELAAHSSAKTKEVILSIKEFLVDPSGGTIATLLELKSIDPKDAVEWNAPWFLSPIPGPPVSNPTNALGMRYDPVLGALAASSFGADQNRAMVHRTWGLLGGGAGYGPHFRYSEYDGVSGVVAGVLGQLRERLLDALLASAILRGLLKAFLPAPGEGPDVAASRKTRVTLEAVAVADDDGNGDGDGAGRRAAFASFTYPGGSYLLTSAFLAQGAASLLYGRKLEGGVESGSLTPAFLGQDLIDRMDGVGGKFTVKYL